MVENCHSASEINFERKIPRNLTQTLILIMIVTLTLILITVITLTQSLTIILEILKTFCMFVFVLASKIHVAEMFLQYARFIILIVIHVVNSSSKS